MPGFIGSERPYRDGPREADLTLIALFAYHNGPGHCYHLVDEPGRLIVAFSKRKPLLSVGERVRATFVVQAHFVYEGVQQNIVKKFRILERL